MIVNKIVKKESYELDYIICDRCKKEFGNIFEIQEFLKIKRNCGYGSIFGDGNSINLDLCQKCQLEILGDLIRIGPEINW